MPPLRSVAALATALGTTAMAAPLGVAALAPSAAGTTASPATAGAAAGQLGPVAADVVADDAALRLSVLGRYSSGSFGQSAAEIVTHDPGSQRVFVVNALNNRLDVLDASDPSAPVLATTVAFDEGEVPNSVDVRADGLLAVAVEAPVKTDRGRLVLLDGRAEQPEELRSVRVGALPDMVTWTPDGRKALVANEGEPAAPGDDGVEDAPEVPGYAADPVGSVSVVTVVARGGDLDRLRVRSRTAGFERFEPRREALVAAGLRLTGPDERSRTLARNLEPEYVTVAEDGRTAWVSLQENNALAEVDLVRDQVRAILPLDRVDHSVPGQGIDPSDRDGVADVRTVPVTGIEMPDSIASYTAADGETYVVTANEGDARAWGDEDTWRETGGFFDEVRGNDLGEDGFPPVCASSPAADLMGNRDLGRLVVSWPDGLSADGSCVQDVHAFGARSISVVDTTGATVWSSGSSFEDLTAAALPDVFNSNHEEVAFDNRSDNKGPEPEGVTVEQVTTASGEERTYSFTGFERVGGVVVHDVTDPRDVRFVQYLNPRDFSVDTAVDDDGNPPEGWEAAGDLGPEGLAFVAAQDSPLPGVPLLVVGNEVSGTTTFFRVDTLG
ncbi:choice-of-anchor I family protein [Pseudokineococcus sp. 1T1Z-3]|uniref:choice-of-anchor I family protein n=1 Tax=Pseudokineococcus sp. 1T1Z-3 TaxID=3132745 RepID=UPI0030B2539A